MVGKSKQATKADKLRFLALREVGCVCCRIEGRQNPQIDVHHIVEGGRRLGHHATLPLCPWHHRGIGPEGMAAAVVTLNYGPSLAHSKRDFNARYGTQRALLDEVNRLIEVAA